MAGPSQKVGIGLAGPWISIIWLVRTGWHARVEEPEPGSPYEKHGILYDIGDGRYEPLSRVSTGQKAVALLIMALSEGSMPIVIDQPEDSLDLRSVWDDICTKIRKGKERRQFIFTTHNASLAVASDTDCFTVMTGDASRGEILYSGSMDHDPLDAEVLTYLEGGPETYAMKFRKYNADRRLETQG